MVHLHTPSDLQLPVPDPFTEATLEPARVGFVVSRAVGGSVQRNRVTRRLRHLCREVVGDLPSGSLLVVRALPGAATASYDELRADLGHGLSRVLASGPVSREAADSGVRR